MNAHGFTAGDWFRLLRENRFAVDFAYRGRWMATTVLSFMNSWYCRKEEQRFGAAIADAKVREPLFILGHWRSGTTLLHTLLALDEQFTFPNLFQVSRPHTFIIREKAIEERLAKMPPQKRSMDNIKVTIKSPGEDEPALAILSLRSPLLAWMFPRREEHYDQYLTFCDVSDKDALRWKAALLKFLKKLTVKCKRPILVKSPTHTARIRLILDLFPDARFVHIHRDPYTVFQSTRRLYETTVPKTQLQHRDGDCVDEGILRRYRTIYDAFFEERKLIPDGQFCEISYEELEQDQVGQIGKIYESLRLPGFGDFEPRLRHYVASNADYKRNVYPPLDESVRSKVAQAWQLSFQEWSYAI